MRMTTQRETILEILRSTTAHPTAEWIYKQARERIPHISLGTVYRNLKVLRDAGEILELDYGSTYSRFDGNAENHYHFICQECGQMLDLKIPVISGLEEKVQAQTDLKVHWHRLEFYGVCQECQAAGPKAEEH